MNKLFWLLLLFPVAHCGFGQSNKTSANSADATLGIAGNQGAFSLSVLHTWKLGARQKFGIGVGGRFTTYVAQNQYYVTAPASLTSGSTGPLVIFKDNVDANIDTLLVKSPQVNSFNLFIDLNYTFNNKWRAGFNIDAIGFSFGGSRQANYINGSTGKITQASPTPFNVLLVSDNDRGSLNSELYVNYFINDTWGVKAGAQFLFTEYTTTTKVQVYPEENDRFRNKSLLLCLGVTRRF